MLFTVVSETATHVYLFFHMYISANVLLDLSFRAKVGDFGLARALDQHDSTLQYKQQTHRVVGTSGYIAPEYYHGTITTKLDTYAFGVVSDNASHTTDQVVGTLTLYHFHRYYLNYLQDYLAMTNNGNTPTWYVVCAYFL